MNAQRNLYDLLGKIDKGFEADYTLLDEGQIELVQELCDHVAELRRWYETLELIHGLMPPPGQSTQMSSLRMARARALAESIVGPA